MIAQAVAELALELGAEAAVHGCTGKGNDQLRFELAFRANYPGVRVIAPLRDKVWTRDEEIDYALARGIPVTVTPGSPFSIDENLFGRSIEAGILEDPWEAPPEEAFRLTADPAAAPPPVEVVIGFEAGLPVSLDGDELPLHELVAALNVQAGAYGIGRIDMIENRAVGIKSRELYEAPAAMTLIAAHRALEDLVLTRAELEVKRGLEDRWARTVYDGLWFSPLREALDAFVDRTQELVARRGARPAPAGRRRRERAPVGARALRRDAWRRTRPARRSRTRPRRGSSACCRSRRSWPPPAPGRSPSDDPLGRSRRGSSRARGVGLPARARRGAPALRLRGDAAARGAPA